MLIVNIFFLSCSVFTFSKRSSSSLRVNKAAELKGRDKSDTKAGKASLAPSQYFCK